MELRPYQLDAIALGRELLRTGKRRLLIVCPTGGGKTVIAAEIIRSAVAKGSRIAFLAHRRELIQQTVDKLLRFGVTPGVVLAGVPAAPYRQVQVAGVQTLIRRPGLLPRIDIVFFDEAHHVTLGSQYTEVLSWWPNAIVVGLTATPWRLDGRGLADVFDAHVLSRTPAELRDEGFLVPVGGWEYEAIDTSKARVQGGDYVAKDLERSASSTRVVGDIVAEWLQHAEGARTVLFALSVAHSQTMAQAFVEAGVPAEHVDGEMAASERDAILGRLRAGITRVVTNCNVLTEGFDLPELECCILARPTLSTALYLQMVGRVLRPAPGKVAARIHDHAGCLARHGHPYAARDYSPTTTGNVSRDSDDGAGAARRLRCASCNSVIARWPCDSCGYSPTPKELQLELDAEARRKEIADDPAAPKQPETDETRRRRWVLRYAGDEVWKRAFFDRMVERHGAQKGRRIYYWFSGKTEWPRREWLPPAPPAGAAA